MNRKFIANRQVDTKDTLQVAEEVKETPSVFILDERKPVVKKDKPKRKLIVIIAIFLCGMTAVRVTFIERAFKQ